MPKWDKALSSCSLEGKVLSTFQPCHLYLSADLIPLGMIMITLLTGNSPQPNPQALMSSLSPHHKPGLLTDVETQLREVRPS